MVSSMSLNEAAFLVTGWAITVAGAALFIWAFFGDQIRGWLDGRSRRRCPRCWYDLSGVRDTRRCAECGYEAPRERDLRRSKRRYPAAFAGLFLLLVVGYLVRQTPAARARGWAALAPDSVLIAWAHQQETDPRSASPTTSALLRAMAPELDYRLSNGLLSAREYRRLVRGFLSVEPRTEWPADFEAAPWNYASVWFLSNDFDFTMMRVSTPDDPRDSTGRLEVEVALWSAGGAGAGSPIESAQFEFPVQVVATSDEALQPVRSEAFDQLVAESLDLKLVFPSLPGQWPWITVTLDSERSSSFEEVAFGFRVEIMRGDTVVQTERIYYPADCFHGGRSGGLSVGIQPADWPREALANPDEWSLRISGDSSVAAGDWSRSRYWAGEFVVPLRDAMRIQP